MLVRLPKTPARIELALSDQYSSLFRMVNEPDAGVGDQSPSQPNAASIPEYWRVLESVRRRQALRRHPGRLDILNDRGRQGPRGGISGSWRRPQPGKKTAASKGPRTAAGLPPGESPHGFPERRFYFDTGPIKVDHGRFCVQLIGWTDYGGSHSLQFRDIDLEIPYT
jgi:hypothetical protein